MSSPLVETSIVAQRLKVTPRQVSRLVRDGKITPAQQAPGIRGAFLFTEAEVARVVEERAS